MGILSISLHGEWHVVGDGVIFPHPSAPRNSGFAQLSNTIVSSCIRFYKVHEHQATAQD